MTMTKPLGTQINFNDRITVPSSASAPSSPTEGDLYYNTTDKIFYYYNGTAWKGIDSPPTVSSLDVTEVDSAAGGNQTIVITGSGFGSGATVTFVGNAGTNFHASTVTVNSSTQITAVAPKSSFLNAQEPYGVKVTNPSGLSGTISSQINVDSAPSWTTASGNIGTVYEDIAMSTITVSATDVDGDTISYSVAGGYSLPTGLSLNSANGEITGTPNVNDAYAAGGVTHNFTLTATANSKTSDRAFNIVRKWYDGSTQAQANTSAEVIKTLTSTTTNGVYWIKPTGIGTAFQVYCNMNIDGGIMLLMKFNNGSTNFAWNSSYWTSNSLLNDGTPTITVDNDYKYQSARDIPINYFYITDSAMSNGYKYTLSTGITGIHNIFAGTNAGFSATSAIGNGISDNQQIYKTDTGYSTGMVAGSTNNSTWSKNSSATSNSSWGGYARIGKAQAFDYGPWESVHGEARGLGLRADDYNQGTGYRSAVWDQLLWGK